MARSLILWVALSVLVPAFVQADGPRDAKNIVRTLSFDSGYVPPITTNPSMWNFWSEMDGLGSGLFDVVSQKTFIGKTIVGRLIWGLVYPAVWVFPSYSLFVSNHELGHGSRGIAIGTTATYAWNNSISHPTIFSFFGEGLIRFLSGASTTTAAGLVRANPTNWDIVITAAGMNNSQMYGEHVANRIARGNGHFLESVGYFWAKTDPLFYALTSMRGGTGATDDVSNMLAYYQASGYGVNHQDLIIGGAVSYFGSFSTYALLWGHLRYFGTGFGATRGFRFGPVRAPDVAFFQNRQGVSYRVTTGLEFTQFGIPISIEYVYKGSPVAELSSGISYAGRTGRQDLWLAKAYINSQLGVGLEALKEIPLGKWGVLTLATGLFTMGSLQGERNVNYVLSNDIGFDGWARLGILL
jgi:hypothetical protein